MMRALPASFLIALAVFLVDQATKYYIKLNVGFFDVIGVTPFFNIVYAENTGSAFGMFKSLGIYFFIGVSIVAVVLLGVMIVRDGSNRFAYSLLLGGAAGNLLDRAVYGYVVDFLDFYIGSYHWPAFNVADSSLTIGIAFLFVKTLRGKGN